MTAADRDAIVEASRAGWIADAAALCRVLDQPADDETIHVLDAATLPEEARRHALAWTAPGLDRVLRDRLRDRRRGPVLVLDVAAIVRHRVPVAVAEHELAALGRLEVSQVAIHELAHARLAEAGGSALPEWTTLPLLLDAVGTPTLADADREKHGHAWVRAYLLLSGRAARSLWPRQWWLDAAVADVRRYVDVSADQLLAAIQPEIDVDEQLVDVLRRPAPPAYLDLFDRLTRRKDDDA